MNNLNDILNLPTSERLAVIRQIWESIDSSSVELTDEQKQELDIRMKRVKSGEASFKSWDEVKKGLH